MDFFTIKERSTKEGVVEVYPDFKVIRSKDLMIRAKSFYAIWDEKAGLWSTNEYDVPRLVDEALWNHAEELKKRTEGTVRVKALRDFGSSSWLQFRNYIAHLSDSSHQLDEHLTFADTVVKKTDYVSKRLPYSMAPGDISAYDEMMSVLYDPEERAKLEWAIGAIIAGDSKHIQKFLVLYGGPGTGKSTWLNLVQKMLEGYYSVFDAKKLTSSNNAFGTAAFESNPMVAIQHDGDLSKIEDNTMLNSIVSHEPMEINQKYKPGYKMVINSFLLMGTNTAVKITDAKSGIIRRLIDVQPTGEKLSPRKYQTLVSQLDFELGAIAHYCLERYREMGKNYYEGYRATEMMLQTDVFFNFIEAYFDVFKEQDGVTLDQAYKMYKQFCEDSDIQYRMPRYKLREELKNYFGKFDDRAVINDIRVRSWYSDFNADKFKTQNKKEEQVFSLVMDEVVSLFDAEFADQPAQYSNQFGNPKLYWDDSVRFDARTGKEFTPKPNQVSTTFLRDLDTSKEHYVKVPPNLITIDFDLTDENGEKSLQKNLEAASQWPPTYAEYSKSELGIHLEYYYTGDPTELANVYDEGIEIKVYGGNSALRRKLTKCNNVPIATISGGLPLKEKKVMNSEVVKSERALRDLILRNLRKEIHPGTKPSMDFIHKILEDAYKSGLVYDVTDMRNAMLNFAGNSTNNALYCLKLITTMKFASEATAEEIKPDAPKTDTLVYFDCEVYPNLFILSWKYDGDPNVTRMVNPRPEEVEAVMGMKLVGYNCRRYDNHILYGAAMGYNNKQLYELSQKLINNVPGAYFGEAYNISYVDIYDYASEKKSLKKWGIELKQKHIEMSIPWDEPVPEELWDTVGDYCDNDVRLTEVVHHHREQDFIARQILADLSGLPVNSSTQQHTARIIFGDDRKPQDKFEYTKLADMFEGYHYEFGESHYRGEITGEGGYVYAEPGMYEEVALLDVASMHPTSIEQLNLFGEYTKNFSALKEARLAIKRQDYDSAKKMLDGKLARHLTDPEAAEALSYALKIVINIVYGLTAARFDNSFKDPRNIDNIVAKRGALFMIDCKYMVQDLGYRVAHIKTDSIKIPNADKAIIEAVMEYGDQFGYTFEHEATYEKMCLVNDAVYIAKTRAGRKPAQWVAVGAQFQHPFVFKTLFSKEKVEFDDLAETKQVQTALYLDFASEDPPAVLEGAATQRDPKELRHVGKIGKFVPIKPGRGGALLMREKDGKFYAATGTKGYRWLEADVVKELGREDDIDMSYYEKLVDDAVKTISQFGDFERFVA